LLVVAGVAVFAGVAEPVTLAFELPVFVELVLVADLEHPARNARLRPSAKIGFNVFKKISLANRRGIKIKQRALSLYRRALAALRGFNSNSLKNSGCAHSAADAHGDHPVTPTTPLQLSQDGGRQLRAGAA